MDEDRTRPVSELMALLLERFGHVQQVPEKAIIDALLGRLITRLDVYGQVTVADLIAGGALLNCETIAESFVARSSPFILRAWLRGNRKPLSTYLQRVFDALNKLGQLSTDNKHSPRRGWLRVVCGRLGGTLPLLVNS